jgi:hypothetical protein
MSILERERENRPTNEDMLRGIEQVKEHFNIEFLRND